ncbi:minichromosome maintenance protein MCM [Candidatus Woesearchaeota archaeon]|nr:minichromosome maintenance protein MCM [Candidatus Woesearchaeota archaeon]
MIMAVDLEKPEDVKELTADEQITRWQEFLERNYYAEIAKILSQGEKVLIVDFAKLAAFDPLLAEQLLDMPQESIRAAEIAVERFELAGDKTNFRVRFRNLPKTQRIAIRDIRSKHIGKLVQLQGIIRQKSDVRPQVTSAKFECPSCGAILTVLQVDNKFREPTRCACGRKGGFRLIEKSLVDVQRIILEEAPEDLEGGEQPKRIAVLLREDLVSPMTERKTNPGSKVTVIGVIEEVPITLASGGKSTRFDLIVQANNVEPLEESFLELQISAEEEDEILKLSQDPKIYQRLVNSVAPTIYGHEKVKEALVLQMFGGVRKAREDGVVTRGDIHILLVGDPGSGKSQILKRIAKIAPKARYVSGKGISGAGLTATVVRDEFLRGWALEAGALVLTNQGICCIDELDKMSKEDRDAMHEALEQQSISISKANIQATLRAETTVLAAANPKFGRFDPTEVIAKQIDLPSTLINRFDLIFPIKDLPNKDKDEAMASFILKLHKDSTTLKPEIDTKLLRKYIAYARQKIKPKLTDAALEEIKQYYLKMRSASSIEEGGIRTIPISARQLEALVRLAEASAKTRLSSRVTKKDARRAIDLVHYCLAQIGTDPETGRIDIDRVITGIPASQRSQIAIVRDIIAELEVKSPNKEVAEEDVISLAEQRGVPRHKCEEILEKLKRSGDIYNPKRGVIQRI